MVGLGSKWDYVCVRGAAGGASARQGKPGVVHGLQARRRMGHSSLDWPSGGMSLFRADPSGGLLVCQILGGSM